MARQLINQCPSCDIQAHRLFNDTNRYAKRPLSTSEYVPLIESLVSQLEQDLLIVDALDEAPEKDAFVEILKRLSTAETAPAAQGTATAKARMKILVTSRLDLSLERNLRSLCHSRLHLDETAHEGLNFFVESEIQARITSKKLKVRDKTLLTQISNTIKCRGGK
jgi:hypothetical protein